MVVSALMQLAIAAPVGALFGAAYGTAIRVGYEIIFPALFGDKNTPQSADTVLAKMDSFYRGVGGLEANAVGINVGIKNALKAMDADPELQELIKKNSNLDTQTIIVNLSGSSIQGGDPSQSSPSDVDTTGGLAERQRRMREKFDIAKKAFSQKLMDSLWREVVALGSPSRETIIKLVQTGTVNWFSIQWQYGLFSLVLQKEIQEEYNRVLETTIEKHGVSEDTLTPKVEVVAVRPMVMHQTWAKVSTQTLNLKRVELVREFILIARKLQTTPKTWKRPIYKIFKFGKKSKKKIVGYKIIPNQKYTIFKKNIYDPKQQQLLNITLYISWRKSK